MNLDCSTADDAALESRQGADGLCLYRSLVALYSTNKRSSDDSGELRGKELERIADTSSATEQQSDALMHFRNRAHTPNPPKGMGETRQLLCVRRRRRRRWA